MKRTSLSWFKNMVPAGLKERYVGGTHGISWYHLIRYYLRKADQEDLRMRATYMSFNLLLALFPGVIFFFTLVAYLPFDNAHDSILRMLGSLLPESTYKILDSTLEDILKKQRGGLLSFGFAMAVYFSTSAVDSMLKSFHRAMGITDKRPWYKKKTHSILLNLYVSLLLVVALGLVTLGNGFFRWLLHLEVLNRGGLSWLLSLLNWGLAVVLVLALISSIYTFGPYKKDRWKFITPGSVVATLLIVFTSLLLTLYVNNFNAYNKVYGSMGALIVMMLFIYWSCLVTLIGFELNLLVDELGRRRKHREIDNQSVENMKRSSF